MDLCFPKYNCNSPKIAYSRLGFQAAGSRYTKPSELSCCQPQDTGHVLREVSWKVWSKSWERGRDMVQRPVMVGRGWWDPFLWLPHTGTSITETLKGFVSRVDFIYIHPFFHHLAHLQCISWQNPTSISFVFNINEFESLESKPHRIILKSILSKGIRDISGT